MGGAFLFGYHLGIVNAAMAQIAATLGFTGDASTAGAVVSMALAGATVGSFAAGPLGDGVGRKNAMVVNGVAFLASGAIMCARASTIRSLLVGRFLSGVGIGVSSALVPLYINEVAPEARSGFLGSFNQVTICVGILGALVAGE